MTRKGQISPDYLVAIILLGIMALSIFNVYGNMNAEAFETVERLYLKDLADDIAHEVNSVVAMGDGSERSITLPRTLKQGKPYNLTIQKNALLIRSDDRDYAHRFATADINQTIINLEPGEILIKNINGRIYFEKVL